MVTKRGNIVKRLAKLIQEFPPENVVPSQKPNNRLRAIIDENVKGKLESAVLDAEATMLSQFLKRKAEGRQ